MKSLSQQTVKRFASMGLALAATLAFTSANAAVRDVEVDARSSEIFTYRADPGETFNVRIRGDGDTDVDLFIRTQTGQTVCASRSTSDRESCTIYSPYGGVYRIELRNLGNVFNDVRLWLI